MRYRVRYGEKGGVVSYRVAQRQRIFRHPHATRQLACMHAIVTQHLISSDQIIPTSQSRSRKSAISGSSVKDTSSAEVGVRADMMPSSSLCSTLAANAFRMMRKCSPVRASGSPDSSLLADLSSPPLYKTEALLKLSAIWSATVRTSIRRLTSILSQPGRSIVDRCNSIPRQSLR